MKPEETTICDYCGREIDEAKAYELDGAAACPDCYLDAQDE